jgi:hypothetical protein
MNQQTSNGLRTKAGSTYLGAMKIAIEIIEMCESPAEAIQLAGEVNDILHGDKIAPIFEPSE